MLLSKCNSSMTQRDRLMLATQPVVQRDTATTASRRGGRHEPFMGARHIGELQPLTIPRALRSGLQQEPA